MIEKQVDRVTEHGFSSHSRRPWDCRICKRSATVHTHAARESQVTWMDANTPDVTARMEAYGDRTLNALRTLASLPTIVQWDLGKGRGLHATAVKILIKDGILVDTAPGEPASTWVISPVGAQLCLRHGIQIGAVAETAPVVEISTELDASDIAEGIAQAWAEAGSPRDDQGQPVILTVREQITALNPSWASVNLPDSPAPAQVDQCTLCGRTDTLGRDDQVIPFSHECVTAAQAEAGVFRPVLPEVGQWIMWQGFSYMVESRYSDGRMNLMPYGGYQGVTPDRPIAELMAWGEVKWPNFNCINCGPRLSAWCIRCTPCDMWGHKTGEPPLAPASKIITDADMRDQVSRYLGESGLVVDRACVSAIVDDLQAHYGTVDIDSIDGEQFTNVVDFHMGTIEEGVPALPVRTPGHTLDSWDMAEREIWAGTEHLGSMRVRLPRKAKKAGRNPLGARRRPIDVKRARIASGSVR